MPNHIPCKKTQQNPLFPCKKCIFAHIFPDKMYRKNIKNLIKWKLSKNRKPLIVQGARQVGKTWLIKEFGKTEFKHTIYVNFEKEIRLQELFLQDLSPKRIIATLETFFTTKINPEDTLIVFDEIQSSQHPRGLLR